MTAQPPPQPRSDNRGPTLKRGLLDPNAATPLLELNHATPFAAALAYAQRGWPVFPVAGISGNHCSCKAGPICDHPAKHPLNRHGLRDATTDPLQLARWWRTWPTANVAIRTGVPSGLVIVDIDPAHDAIRTLDTLAQTGRLPTPTLDTLTVATGGNGHHLYYQHPRSRVPNTTSQLPTLGPTPGVDLRGDGGYIIAPPSTHRSGHQYQWNPGHHTPARLPTWAQPAPPTPRPAPPAIPALNEKRLARYVQAALDRETTSVAKAPQGQRNQTLNKAAYRLGTLVGAGVLDQTTAQTTLAAAAQTAGLTPAEIITTINSGLNAGITHPRPIPAPLLRTASAQPAPPAIRASL